MFFKTLYKINTLNVVFNTQLLLQLINHSSGFSSYLPQSNHFIKSGML